MLLGFNKINANAEILANETYGKVILPSNKEVYSNDTIYRSLKNKINYGMTGNEREIRNRGKLIIERW